MGCQIFRIWGRNHRKVKHIDVRKDQKFLTQYLMTVKYQLLNNIFTLYLPPDSRPFLMQGIPTGRASYIFFKSFLLYGLIPSSFPFSLFSSYLIFLIPW